MKKKEGEFSLVTGAKGGDVVRDRNKREFKRDGWFASGKTERETARIQPVGAL